MNINITGPDGTLVSMYAYLYGLNEEMEARVREKMQAKINGTDEQHQPEPKDLTDEELDGFSNYGFPTSRMEPLIHRLVSEVKRRRKEDADRNAYVAARKEFVDSTFSPYTGINFGCTCDECQKTWSSARRFAWNLSHVCANPLYGRGCPCKVHKQAQKPHLHEWVYDKRKEALQSIDPRTRVFHKCCSCGATKTEVITEKT